MSEPRTTDHEEPRTTDHENETLAQVRSIGREAGSQAVLLSALTDIRWSVGFTGSNGWLLVETVTDGAAHLLTDGRYKTQAAQEVPRSVKVHVVKGRLDDYLKESGLLPEATSVLFQADDLSVSAFMALRERLPGLDWRPGKELLVQAVASKTPVEVARIRKAQAITEAVFDHLLGWLKPGLREHEVAAEIVYQHLQRGASGMSFEPIVASGPNGALPHARPSARQLALGDLVVLDMGCFLDGYASDMTRTVAIGKVDDEAQRVYQVVLEAQECALEAARGGISSPALDAVARDVIEAAGYGNAFTHSLGHGLGLQIHEWPRVSYQVDYTLPEGAVVTIEPGVYLPDRFGVRIEDIVVLREDGSENLTRAPKGLIEI